MAIGMPSNHQMLIPKSRGDVVFQFAATVVIVFFTLLAIVNLCNGVALIASVIWLALVAAMVWSASQEAGGLRLFLTSLIGDLFGRRFVESHPAGGQPRWPLNRWPGRPPSARPLCSSAMRSPSVRRA